ncbi:MAG: PAS domain-containing protein [Candidatus Methanoperedens sp.]|nr:PAS domain-containing protein [Candidatus Methanoperedens sp.]
MTEKVKTSDNNKKQNPDLSKGDQNPGNTEEPSSQAWSETDKQDEKETFPIVGIGASAGGLEALEKFFANMPSDSEIAFIIVMHFDPKAKSVMPDILKRYTKMEVFQVEDGMKVRQNCVYIIPPNKDMAILHGILHLYEPIVHRGVRHPIDFFFRSLADDQKEKAICIILSGTGTEGTLGLKAIKGEGGMVIVQNIESALYDGMPRSAIATELVDFILPPEKIPEQLLNYVKQFYATGIRPAKVISEQIASHLQKIIILVRDNTGLDFSHYKQGTLIRRIERRMNLHQIDKIADYVHYLQENQPEIYILYKEFLIGVTSFFRDPDAFENLKKNSIPEVLKGRNYSQPVRCWVTACSTGEEAYSLAIIFREYMDEVKSNFKIQIFATDVDREAIEVARTGVYPENIAIDVSPERLSRFFVKKSDLPGYSIKKDIREMVVFAPQNVISDPPFLKIDLIICRNLLIYLVPDVQKKLLYLFHYSLNPAGFLFLGSSETIGELTDLYTAVDKKWKIFRSTGEKAHLPLIAPPVPAPRIEVTRPGEVRHGQARIAEQAEKILLDAYAPPCVIANEKGDILYIHGRTGKYLEPAPGRPSWNILEMAREGIRTELNIALHTAVTQKKDAIFRDLSVKTNGGYQTINLTIKPIREPETMAGLILVTFEDVPVHEHEVSEEKKAVYEPEELKKYVSNLEKELKSTRENLQATIEELQASNEELRSTNEELQSANEELQSTNEELNASKEELQSLNEELVTLNSEHQTKIEELSRTVSDLNNVISSSEIATIFLDGDSRIKGFTPAATRIINLIRTDIGRPIIDIATNLVYKDLSKDADEVLNTLVPRESEMQDTKNKKWYLMKILPYRTAENIIEGVVITFINITERKRCEKLEHDARVFTDNIIDTMRESVLVLDKDLKVIMANKSFYRTFQVSQEDTMNKHLYDTGNRQWDIPELKEKLEDVLQKGTALNDFVVEHEFSGTGRKVMLLNAHKIYQPEGAERILLAIEDITECLDRIYRMKINPVQNRYSDKL